MSKHDTLGIPDSIKKGSSGNLYVSNDFNEVVEIGNSVRNDAIEFRLVFFFQSHKRNI